MSHDCIFCKIVKGDIPATRLYENTDVLAFMDISPVVKGHALVIPKSHHNPLMETPPEILQKLILVVQRVAQAQMKGLQADGINVSQANGKVAGQIVPHIHFHVIPRFNTDGYHSNWNPKQYETPQELEDFAKRIRDALIQ